MVMLTPEVWEGMSTLTRASLLQSLLNPQICPDTLRLTQGFGAGCGDTISLRCPGPVPKNLERILLSYSCYAPALPKIRTCLENSGRYDCEVQTIWFRSQAFELERELREAGISLTILRLTDTERLSRSHADLIDLVED